MEISEALDQKLAWRFRTYDNDGDGYIEREDFELAARRTGEEFGHTPDSPALRRLTALLIGLWDHLATVADADRDGRISEAEYKAAFAAGLLETPESFDEGYVPFLDAVMEIIDTEVDGKLTADEHVRWTRPLMRLPEADARALHQRIDADGDGYVTKQELLDAIRELYFYEEPDTTDKPWVGLLDH